MRSVGLLLMLLCAIGCDRAEVVAVADAACASPSCIVGRVVGVTDGDTVTLLTVAHSRLRVRLTEIDTPERGQPGGARARQVLADKVFNEIVNVTVYGNDRYGRTLGRVWLGARDINRELVREGYAWAYRQYLTDTSLLEDERLARAEMLGLWSSRDSVPPWNWRRGARSSSSAIAGFSEGPSGCGTKTRCGEMSSCAEAERYFRECGLERLDGDNDGTPCESLCP
jgi:endonuclease YncB( thermonuclease family)